jgi:hypothetical protein
MGISGEFSDWQVARGNWNFTDDAGATGTIVIFTVTGDIACYAAASINAELTSTSNNGTIELGVAGNTAALLVQDVMDSTAFQVGDSWTLITASNTNALQIADEALIIGNSVDIIQTIATNAALTGDVDYYLFWRPLSADGNVVPT